MAANISAVAPSEFCGLAYAFAVTVRCPLGLGRPERNPSRHYCHAGPERSPRRRYQQKPRYPACARYTDC